MIIDKAYNLGTVALKIGLAYMRTLRYERVTASVAENAFNNLFNTKHFSNDWIDKPAILGKDFQDYMLHLPNLFLEYPDITFDIFHISYPYQNKLIVLDKNFRNVFVDMCWAHIVSPNASVNFLLEFIDTVPLNKITAFGGDYLFVDGVYGHLVLAKKNVAEALSIKVRGNLFDIEYAKEIARKMFYDNPINIFRLKE